MLYKEKPHIKKVTTAWEDADWAPERKIDLAGRLNVHIECRSTGKMHIVQVMAGDMDRWLGLGQYAQTVFSYLNEESRELLISGTSPEAWTRLFGDEELDMEEETLFKLKNSTTTGGVV
jgi:hypothetical protein